jgi:hypothetical protein
MLAAVLALALLAALHHAGLILFTAKALDLLLGRNEGIK